MILYEVFPNKTLKILEDEKTYITENLISSVHIKLPSTFGDYPVKELTAELRFYFPEGDYMAYEVDTQQARPEVPITNDITEKPQTLSVMLFFYKGGNVIGKTNSVDKVILDAPLKGEPLTPRAEADEKIREQQEKIAEQANTITEQTETISSQGEQITELNGEVTELTSENTRLEALTETQRETIQNMLDNPPQPQLYTPPVVTPSGSVQQISPPAGCDGLTNTVVDRVSAAVDPNIVPENIREGVDILGVEGTYNPFPEHSYGGIYYTELGENDYPKKILVKDVKHAYNPFPIFFNTSTDAKRELREFIFENCTGVTSLAQKYFSGLNYLQRVVLQTSLTSIGEQAFYNCSSLQTVNLPSSLTSIGDETFRNCSNLQNINLPLSLTSIGNRSFFACSSLQTINLPSSLTSMGGYVFQYCNSLQTINLPSSLTSMGSSPFDSCRSLQFVTIENNFNCYNLNLSASTLYSVETIVSWLEALADRTGEMAYTLTMGTTNLNKLTAEQKAIAINKNWNLA